MKRIDVVIGIVRNQNKVLVCRRRDEGHLGGFWEFPGGKLEAGETLEQCLKRELLEEVNLDVGQLSPLKVIEHDYPDRQVRLHPYLCEYLDGELKPIGCAEAVWIEPARLREVHFPDANRELVEFLIEHLK
jgi:mutator protein MutT